MGTIRRKRGLGVKGNLRGLEGTRGDVAVLAGQIADLALFRCGRVARWALASLGGVEMSQSSGAVAVGRHWGVVDVVHWTSVSVGGSDWVEGACK